MTRIIALWEAPRSRGTSLMYALYYGLKKSGFACVLRDEPLHWRRLQSIEDNQGIVARQQYIKDVKTPRDNSIDFIIQKEQAKWLFDERTNIGSNLEWIIPLQNVILIRDAYEMVTSHQDKLWQTKDLTNKSLDFEKIGIEQLYKLFIFLDQRQAPCVVVDSNELLRVPERGIRKLCEYLNIPFSKSMLTWGRSKIEPPPWGAHWYEDIMKSDGFYTYHHKEKKFIPPKLHLLVQETEKILDRMRKHCLNFEQPSLDRDELCMP